MTPLPDFESPPVIEVACGVQFRAVEGLRGMGRFRLYEQWRERLPEVVEQPALPPIVEASAGAPPVQIFFNAQDVRHWFIGDSGRELVQLQHDRLIVNWREGNPPGKYPRFPAVRRNFVDRLTELNDYVQGSGLGKIEISHVEVSYINAIDPAGAGLGNLDSLVKGWPDFSWHHLGRPGTTRAVFDFPIPGLGLGSQLSAQFGPGLRTTGETALFMILSAQGRTEATTVEAAIGFADKAHEHIVQSFDEFTTPAMHAKWGKRS